MILTLLTLMIFYKGRQSLTIYSFGGIESNLNPRTSVNQIAIFIYPSLQTSSNIQILMSQEYQKLVFCSTAFTTRTAIIKLFEDHVFQFTDQLI